MTRQSLIDLVQSRIDEVSDDNQLAAIDTQFIEIELDNSATQTLLKARREAVFSASTSLAGSNVYVRKDSASLPMSVIIPLSDDVLRVLRVKGVYWNQYVNNLIDSDGPKYKMQLNPYERGTVNVPFASLIPFNFSYAYGSPSITVSYKQALEIFPAPTDLSGYTTTYSGAEQTVIDPLIKAIGLTPIYYPAGNGRTLVLSDLVVVKKTVAELLPDRLYDALSWHAAASCMVSLRRGDLATILMQKFNSDSNIEQEDKK